MMEHSFQIRNWGICLTDLYEIMETMGQNDQEKNPKGIDIQKAM